jgi:2-oxoglutarate dehydrogenase E1 component
MGGWTFVRDFIEDAMQAANLKQSRLKYAGRPAAASPATGSFARHVKEQKQLVAEALGPMVAASQKASPT